MRMHNPPHPGLVIREYLDGITISDAANHLGVTRAALSRVINGKASISPTMALRLEKAFASTSAETWLNMQAKYDLWKEEEQYENTVIPFDFA